MNCKEEAGATKGRKRGQLEEADKQQTSGQQKLTLLHYLSPDHRSIRKCPIWGSKNPLWYQNDQWHPRAHFRALLLKPGHSRTFVDAFLMGLLGRPIHELINGTQKQRSFREMLMPELCTTHSEQLLGLGNHFGLDQAKHIGFPSDILMVTNASRQAFGTRFGQTEIAVVSEHIRTLGKHYESPVHGFLRRLRISISSRGWRVNRSTPSTKHVDTSITARRGADRHQKRTTSLRSSKRSKTGFRVSRSPEHSLTRSMSILGSFKLYSRAH
ncbi:hypothetical protein CRG98_011304 [Punica granatum]|uniref:Uncharacterized protein n=1 Tax=Punica granatum TaxID=22663 RepID=A0A2I0KIN3_PUNGR|nr:hypothetical protein CRG98_011304 [Punica granatum]